ncbi:RtcB family protein [Sphingomonas faeni]
MLHPGSRGVGNAIGTFFIELANQDMRSGSLACPTRIWPILPEGTDHFDDYVDAVGWAQDYAGSIGG